MFVIIVLFIYYIILYYIILYYIYVYILLHIISYHSSGQWNPLDAIWRHPIGGGTIYAGNQTAASNLSLLHQHEITHIINCTIGASQIP